MPHQRLSTRPMDATSLSSISFPNQSPLDKHSVLASRQSTRDWLKNLATNRLGRTAHELYKVLHELNRSRLSDKERLDRAELFIDPVLQNARRLERHYLNSSFPLSEKDRKVAQLEKALVLELTLSFKIVLRDQLAQRTSLMDLALTAQRVLVLHLATLRQSAITYHNYPRNFWRETHEIYRTARDHKIHLLEVSNDLVEDERLTRLEDVYKQILLFSLSDHYRLRQQDIQLLLKHLPNWIRQTELLPSPRGDETDGFFYVDLNRNTPPLHLSLLPASAREQADSLCMDTRQLIETLGQIRANASLNNLTGQQEIKGITIQTIDHLAFAWKTVPPRQESRTNLKFEVTIAVGLRDIYMTLHKIQREHPDGSQVLPADIASRITSLDDSGMVIDLDTNFWKIDGSDITHIDELVYLEHDSSKPAWTWQEDTEVKLLSYQIINESVGGYCVSWKEQGAPPIKVGQLLGIRHDSNPRLFSVAVSRWMKYEQSHNLLGIAVLSHSSYPIQARLSDREDGLVQHCLLLGEADNDSSRTPRLATPPLAFRAGQSITLFDHTVRIRVQLLEMLEGSSAYNLFSYEEISLSGGAEELSAPEPDASPDDTD